MASLLQVRALFYQFSAALREEETQKKGLVLITYRIGKMDRNPNPMMVWKTYRMIAALPFRIRGWHMCTDNPMFSVFWLNLIQKNLEKSRRMRLRIHQGT